MAITVFRASKPHFFMFYVPGVFQKISIPKAFFRDYLTGEKCVGKATLQTTNSSKSWRVTVKDLCFRDGWKDFAKAHDLRVGDFLVFKHEGGFKFQVLVFDNTLCEKEYPLLNLPEKTIEPTERKKQKDVQKAPEFTITLTASNFKYGTLYVPATFGRENGLVERFCMTKLRDPKGRSWHIRLRYKYQCKGGAPYPVLGGGWREFCDGNNLKVGDVCTFKLVSGGPKKVLMEVSVSKTKSSL